MVCTTRISPMTVMAVVEVVGVIPRVQTSAGCTGAQADIRFAGQRAVRISGDNDKLQFRVQIVGQSGQFYDFTCFAGVGDQAGANRFFAGCRSRRVALRWGAGRQRECRWNRRWWRCSSLCCPALPMPEVTKFAFFSDVSVPLLTRTAFS